MLIDGEINLKEKAEDRYEIEGKYHTIQNPEIYGYSTDFEDDVTYRPVICLRLGDSQNFGEFKGIRLMVMNTFKAR